MLALEPQEAVKVIDELPREADDHYRHVVGSRTPLTRRRFRRLRGWRLRRPAGTTSATCQLGREDDRASTADRVARRQPWQAGRTRLLALVAVLGPGLLAGLSDDDPAGITTYSVLGAQYGYELLWVLLLATVALIVFHDLGARMGVVTGRG